MDAKPDYISLQIKLWSEQQWVWPLAKKLNESCHHDYISVIASLQQDQKDDHG
jgi:hypothetical protein